MFDSKSLNPDPLLEFIKWFDEAKLNSQMKMPDACTLSTVTDKGQPTGRIVLLKAVEENRFFFYTNYQSPKAENLSHNPKCSLTFFWDQIGRQIRVEGSVTKTSRQNSETYFSTRPRESQLGAYASEQGRPIPDREYLMSRYQAYEKQFEGSPIPCPEHWGGYTLSPTRIEFWIMGEFRLHDRFVYDFDQTNKAWNLNRLAP